MYFGIRSYRDTVRGGRIGFGRAFVVGSLIALISSACYTATWEAIYFGGFVPNFAERYSAHELDRLKASGASQAAIDRRTAELQQFAVMYRNPAVNAAMTLVEPLPVGLVIALVSAGILSRGRKPETREAFGAA